MYNDNSEVRALHGEILPTRRFTELYIRQNTEVELADVEAVIAEVGRGVIELGRRRGHMKFGGYMLGGLDENEAAERNLLRELCARL
jgi:hypothetical protein